MNLNDIEALNEISEVIINRPKPIREFDQIYMRAGDMLMQTEHVSKLFHNRNVVFIGDGDSISLCLVHLFKQKVINHGPKHVHVLDFDERIVNSVKAFAKRFDLEDFVSAECYNVANALPKGSWQAYDGFYSNPPFGESNGGKSIEAFLLRGLESLNANSVASVVVADDPTLPWTQQILFSTQQYMANHGFVVSESLPAFHTYHLEDNPKLRSCSLSFRNLSKQLAKYQSKKLPNEMLKNFYGKDLPLTVERVKDNLIGNKMPSRDYEIISL